ncbi:hypothetical protein LQZ21_01695 [Treponema sp. TIM-1]|uniref:hypothetical protein n=1 Tax=Treponema sp. TIM-1 TaxID=2898417 RepID=UPI00397FE476
MRWFIKKRRIPGMFFLAFLGGITVLGITYLYPMDWPSQEARITRNFGWNDEGRPSLGNIFLAEGPIRAADKGELIFYHTPSNTASVLPSPLGSWIALEHGDGIIGIYSRFEDMTNPALPDIIDKDVVIASAGQSGWTNQGGFYFSLFDRRERRWVNPSTIIAPLEDTMPPQIQSVLLKTDRNSRIDLSQAKTIRQGRYTVLVAASDTRINPNEIPLAPYRIVCSLNGIEIGVLTFETFSIRDGVLMVYRNSLVPVQQVYSSEQAFEIGEVEFIRGQATLTVIAQDITGNVRNNVYRFLVE